MDGIQIVRPVLSVDVVLEAARSMGVEVTRPEKMHITLMRTLTPVNWDLEVFEPMRDEIIIPEGAYDTALFGNGDVVVILIPCPALELRHEELVRAGASWDFPSYNPHISLGIQERPMIQERVTLKSRIILGPEHRKIP